MATKKDLAIDAVRSVHANTAGTLEDVKEDLEEICDLVTELIQAIDADIEMQQDVQS